MCLKLVIQVTCFIIQVAKVATQVFFRCFLILLGTYSDKYNSFFLLFVCISAQWKGTAFFEIQIPDKLYIKCFFITKLIKSYLMYLFEKLSR